MKLHKALQCRANWRRRGQGIGSRTRFRQRVWIVLAVSLGDPELRLRIDTRGRDVPRWHTTARKTARLTRSPDRNARSSSISVCLCVYMCICIWVCSSQNITRTKNHVRIATSSPVFLYVNMPETVDCYLHSPLVSLHISRHRMKTLLFSTIHVCCIKQFRNHLEQIKIFALKIRIILYSDIIHLTK